MFELFHQRDLTDRGRWCAFFRVEVNLFLCDEFARLPITAFENLMIRISLRSGGDVDEEMNQSYRGICTLTEL